MPVLDYDYNYGTRTHGNLARAPKKKVVFDQDNPHANLEVANGDFYEEKYAEDFRKIDEKFEIIRRKSFDYEEQAKLGKKVRFNEKPEIVDLEDVEEYEIIEEKDSKREVVLRRVINAILFIIGAAIALLICYRYSVIYEKFNEVEKAKKELMNSQTINEQLQADIDSETDISYIENYAKYQLGMQKPQDYQIVYINTDKKDKIFTPVKVEDENAEKTWFDDLVNHLASIFE